MLVTFTDLLCAFRDSRKCGFQCVFVTKGLRERVCGIHVVNVCIFPRVMLPWDSVTESCAYQNFLWG